VKVPVACEHTGHLYQPIVDGQVIENAVCAGLWGPDDKPGCGGCLFFRRQHDHYGWHDRTRVLFQREDEDDAAPLVMQSPETRCEVRLR